MGDERPTFGSLFAGIGGIDLGLERAGWRGRWQVEYEPFCQRVLAKHWPDVQRYGDIHDVDWRSVVPVDLVAGGFPCQPFSVAGQRRGMDDDRWLWPEFERCLRALRPRYVLVENVPGLLVGRGMDAVLGGLADLGYDTEWESIPAAAVGAPHLRYRVWIIAHRQADAPRPDADGIGPYRAGIDQLGGAELRHQQVGEPQSLGALLADSEGDGRAVGGTGHEGRDDPPASGIGLRSEPRGNGPGAGALAYANGSGPQGRPVHAERPDQWPARSGSLEDATSGRRQRGRPGAGTPQSGRALGLSARSDEGSASGWWLTEPDVGRVAHGVPARVDRLRSLGNAVVPQVVEFIGRRILEAEALT